MDITTDVNTREFYEASEEAEFLLYYLNSSKSDNHHTNLAVADDFVYAAVGGKTLFIEDQFTAGQVKALTIKYGEQIKANSEKEKTLEHVKDDRKNQISIISGGNEFLITHKVTDRELLKFYNQFETELLEIFKDIKNSLSPELEDIKETNIE